ncbi:MAG: hypothetical protein SNJ83_04520 [Aggregatilineales bacterium]|jgi:hypothetical protein
MDGNHGLDAFCKRLALDLQRTGKPTSDASRVASKVTDLVRLIVSAKLVSSVNTDATDQTVNSRFSKKD